MQQFAEAVVGEEIDIHDPEQNYNITFSHVTLFPKLLNGIDRAMQTLNTRIKSRYIDKIKRVGGKVVTVDYHTIDWFSNLARLITEQGIDDGANLIDKLCAKYDDGQNQ